MNKTFNSSMTQTGSGPVRGQDEIQPSQDLVEYLKEYARAKPDVAALWCFGIGFVIGWKLKPW
ncbi:MAG: hypothetical protein KF861_05525 [Planctomycetaceae bacterium]|nr:hypothetical protein [Planctomycetaceae bacterium]